MQYISIVGRTALHTAVFMLVGFLGYTEIIKRIKIQVPAFSHIAIVRAVVIECCRDLYH